jgi:hypothetical protein
MNPNPKTPQDLDPKLKEAYDRVMGGNFTPSTPTAPNPLPKIEPVPAPVTNPIPPLPTPLINPMSVNNMPPLSVMSPSTTALPQQQVISTKKKSRISPVLFLIIGLAFFAIYAVVWAKVFKLF